MTEPVLDYEILERSGNSLQVKFLNPLWEAGNVVDEEYEAENEDGETVTLTRERDDNIHKNFVKTINIPLLEDGTADRDTLKEIIVAQANGVKARMEAIIVVVPDETDLDDLIGASL